MRVLSKAFTMKDTFTQDKFFGILSNCLKRDGALRAFGEALDTADGTDMKLEADGCGFEMFCTEREGKTYAACRCTQETEGVIWTADAVLEQAADCRTVHLRIDSTDAGRDIAGFRWSMLHMFATSKYTEKGTLSGRPETNPDPGKGGWFIPAISGQGAEGIPVVVISQLFASPAYGADAESLARDLDGMACVVCADRDYTRKMRNRGQILPYNGAAAVYLNGSRRRLYRKTDADSAGEESYDARLLQDALRLSSSEADGPSWEMLKDRAETKTDADMSELLEDAFNANTSLEKEVRELKEKVNALSAENSRLLSRARRSRDPEGSGDCIIRKGDVPEFYDEEQYDMIISILQNALAGCSADSRQKELLEQVLARNPIRGKGKEIFETVKRVFTDGSNLTAKDASDLRRVGINIVSDSRHYKLVFKDNAKYMFVLPKTSGDRCCSGKAMASEIISKLSVYRKA